jgi:hypothetical protein
MVLDLLVHERLGEVRLIPLVVPMAAVAEDLQHHVAAEGLAPVEGEAGGVHHRFRVVAVDVKDRHHQHLGDIGGVEGGAGVLRQGGEADLIVEHNVQGAARTKAFELGEVEGLGDQSLAGEGGIAVHQDRQHLLAATVVIMILPGSALPLDHRIDRLQVAGVGRHVDMEGRPRRPVHVGGKTLVVLDVPLADHLVFDVVGEFGEEVLQGLAEDVDQHVEAAAVRHPQHQVPHAERGRLAHHVVEERDERLPPLDGEALLAEEFAVQERLEQGRLLQLTQDPLLLLAGEAGPVAGRFHAVDQPLSLGGVLNVHGLDAGRTAVGLAQGLDDLPQGDALLEKTTGAKDGVEVRFVEVESLEGEQGMFGLADFEGIGAGEQVSDIAVAIDQGLHARLFERMGRIDARRPCRTFLSQLEALEKRLPLRRQPVRRLLPETVKVLNPLRTDVMGKTHAACVAVG